jgi:Tol biopolymer transport system component
MANSWSGNASISADGHFVVFTSSGDNLYSGSTLGINGVYVRDLRKGVTEREDVASDGTPADGSGAPNPDFSRAVIRRRV